MKKIGIIALALAMLMLTAAFTACNGGSGNSNKVVANVTISISTPDGLIVERQVAVEGTAEVPPTVLDAAKLALDIMKQEEGNDKLDYDLEYDKDDNPVRFNSITDTDGNVYKYGALDEEATLYGLWDFTVDDVEAEVGMAATPVAEGQTIKMVYSTITAEELAASSGN